MTAADSLDLNLLRQRYAQERDKRLRADRVAQYVETRGAFAHLVDDPYATPATRAPLERDVDAVIVGAGFGGILSAIRLKEAGLNDILIVDRAGNFGGTWYWNRYPGLAYDMKSYVYLPLLEEVGHLPARNYASGEEIRAHAERLVDHFSLRDFGLFQTEIRQARCSQADGRWLISTVQGDRLRAKYFVSATGTFTRPKLPAVRGLETFRGACSIPAAGIMPIPAATSVAGSSN